MTRNGKPDDLAPCPFCGAGEYSLEPRHLPPRMDGRPSAIVSFTIRHWCEGRAPGVVAASREVRAREKAPAVAEWNRRSTIMPGDPVA
jgi:hypothetical protein